MRILLGRLASAEPDAIVKFGIASIHVLLDALNQARAGHALCTASSKAQAATLVLDSIRSALQVLIHGLPSLASVHPMLWARCRIGPSHACDLVLLQARGGDTQHLVRADADATAQAAWLEPRCRRADALFGTALF